MKLISLMLLACLLSEPWVVKGAVEGVAIQVRGPSGPIPLDADVAITVTATREPDTAMEPPVFVEEIDGAVLSGEQMFGPDSTGEFVSQSWRMNFEPIRAGVLKLPGLRIRIRTAEGNFEEQVLSLPPISISSAEEGATSVDTLKPIPHFSTRESIVSWRTFLILAGVLTGVVTILAVVWPRRSSRQIDRREQAMNELTRIEFESRSGSPRAKAVMAGDVIRNYLEDRYTMPASRQTTWEFLREAGNSPAMASPSKDVLSRAFPLLDEEKFGPEGPSEDDVRRLIAHFREFLAIEPKP